MKAILPLLLLVGITANAQMRHGPIPSATSDVGLVTALLHDLANGLPEAAYARLTDDFRAYGPTFGQSHDASDLLHEWDARQRRFTAQHITVEKATSLVVSEGTRQGTWVYLEATWSAREGEQAVRTPFRQWVRLRDGKLAELHLVPAADALFEEFAALTEGGSNP